MEMCKVVLKAPHAGNQPWIVNGRTDAEAEAPILWPPEVKSQLIGKDPDAGKDWRQEEKGTTEDKEVGWHHWLDGHEFEQALGFGDGQGSLACCSPWSHKESDTTEQLNHHHMKGIQFISSIYVWVTTSKDGSTEHRFTKHLLRIMY